MANGSRSVDGVCVICRRKRRRRNHAHHMRNAQFSAVYAAASGQRTPEDNASLPVMPSDPEPEWDLYKSSAIRLTTLSRNGQHQNRVDPNPEGRRTLRVTLGDNPGAQNAVVTETNANGLNDSVDSPSEPPPPYCELFPPPAQVWRHDVRLLWRHWQTLQTVMNTFIQWAWLLHATICILIDNWELRIFLWFRPRCFIWQRVFLLLSHVHCLFAIIPPGPFQSKQRGLHTDKFPCFFWKQNDCLAMPFVHHAIHSSTKGLCAFLSSTKNNSVLEIFN